MLAAGLRGCRTLSPPENEKLFAARLPMTLPVRKPRTAPTRVTRTNLIEIRRVMACLWSPPHPRCLPQLCIGQPNGGVFNNAHRRVLLPGPRVNMRSHDTGKAGIVLRDGGVELAEIWPKPSVRGRILCVTQPLNVDQRNCWRLQVEDFNVVGAPFYPHGLGYRFYVSFEGWFQVSVRKNDDFVSVVQTRSHNTRTYVF